MHNPVTAVQRCSEVSEEPCPNLSRLENPIEKQFPGALSRESRGKGERGDMTSNGGPPPEAAGRDEVDFVLKVQPTEPEACLGCTKNQKLDKFNIFALRRRPKSDPGTGTIAKHAQQRAAAEVPAPADPAKKKKSRFVKSASIARIFGNNYNTKKFEQQQEEGSGALLKLQQQFRRGFLGAERFQKKDTAAASASAEQQEPKIGDACYVNDSESGPRAIRSITRGLGRLLRRNSHSIEISRPDPEYKVSYLGNVLTGWAKGEFICSEF